MDPFHIGEKSVCSLQELSQTIKEMDQASFRKYVRLGQNDFYNWISSSLKDYRLARDCMKIWNKENIASIIDESAKKEAKFVEKRLDTYSDHFILKIDNGICSGCEICAKVCPKEAISIEKNLISVSDKCTRCGLCVEFCPIFAISMEHNGVNEKVFKGKMPVFSETIINCVRARIMFQGAWEVTRACPQGCEECVKACPVNVLFRGEKDKPENSKEHCLLCGACRNACPEKIIESRRAALLSSGDDYSAAFGKAIESLMGSRARGLYHSEHNHRKLKGMVENGKAK
jgi:Na+-translocating ferredoxin:NAD+ oxidoreductase RNF subunit RnfB